MSAPAVSKVMGVAPERNKESKKYRRNDIWGRVFVNVVSLKYIGMIYIMCFIPMNVHNELFNGVSQLRWQHLSPVFQTFSTSISLLSSFCVKHCILPPSFSCTPSRFTISGLSLQFGDVDVLFSLSKVLCS